MQRNTTKLVKEMNEAVQNLKVKGKIIKKAQTEANMEMENLGKRSGISNVITTKISEIKGRITEVEETFVEIDKTVNANSKHIKLLTQNIQEIS